MAYGGPQHNPHSPLIVESAYTLQHMKPTSSCAFSHRGNFLAVTNGLGAEIWNIRTITCMQTLRGGFSADCCTFSPDDNWVAIGSSNRTVTIWDRRTGHCLRTLKAEDGSGIVDCAFSPDGNLLTVVHLHSIITIWNPHTGECLETRQPTDRQPSHLSSDYINCRAFSLDGNLLVTGHENVEIWNARTMTHIRTLQGHSAPVDSYSFSRDGNWLATTSLDKTMKIWDTQTGACLYTAPISLENYIYGRHFCAFSPTDNLLVTGGDHSAVKIWRIFTPAAAAAANMTRPVTPPIYTPTQPILSPSQLAAAAAERRRAEAAGIAVPRPRTPTPPPVPAAATPAVQPCVACLDQPPNMIVIPCGHLCLCSDCSQILQRQPDKKCPVCRGAMANTFRVYFS